VTNRIASAVLGLLLIVGGVVVIVEMALVASGRRPLVLPLDRWHRSLTGLRVRDDGLLWVSILVGIVGIVLLVAELRRWAPDRVSTSGGSGAPWWLSRRSVERRTATAAATVHGVRDARADVRGRRGRWRLRVRAEAWPDQLQPVGEAVRAELDRLNAPPDTRIDLALRRPRGRVV
jgi:hypothetical protein